MSSQIRVAHIIHSSTVDGPGERAVLFVNGCMLHCPGCQSPRLQSFSGGTMMDVDAVAAELLDTGLPVTVSGGEPFVQAGAVAELLAVLRSQKPDLRIIVYSGFTFEQLCNMAAFVDGVHDILITANVLVDGPYIAERDHPWMQYRGSDNQRPIDLDHTLGYADENGKMVTQRLAVLDWDQQILTIDGNGDIVGTAGQMRELFEETENHRMCGEVETFL